MSQTHPIVSLADPDQALRHVRAMLDPSCFAVPTALVIWCDADGRPLDHLHVLACDVDASPSECAQVLDSLLGDAVRGVGPSPSGIALALTRPGSEQVRAYDRSWFRALHRVCHQRRLTTYGAFVVTRTGARPLHIDDAA